MKRKLLLLLMCASFALTGCGSEDSSSNGTGFIANNATVDSYSGFSSSDFVNMQEIFDESISKETSDSSESSSISADMSLAEEKLVYSCDISIETKEYDDSYGKLKELFSKYGVVIESEEQYDNDYNWYYSGDKKDSATLSAYISCRVPSNMYEDFVDNLNSLGDNTKVVSQSSEVQNISQQYYDNKINVESMEIQEKRLLEMLESASSIDDMLQIEDRLQEVQYELNSLKTKLNYMDIDVAYSYVNISLEEVKEFNYDEEEGFLDGVLSEFLDACDYAVDLFKDLLSFVFHAVPFIILVAIPFLFLMRLVLWMIKKIFKADITTKFKNLFKRKEKNS